MSDKRLQHALLGIVLSADLDCFFKRLRREGQIDFDVVASEPGRLVEIHMFLEHYLGDLYCRADLIVQTAREDVNLRRQAVAPDVAFSEYSKSGQPLIDLVHSEIEAVRPILHASLDAYREMGIPQRELWRFFEAETKFIFRKFPLIPDRFQEVLKSEFSFICLGPIDWKVMREGNDTGFSSATTLSVLEDAAVDGDGNSTPISSITEPIAAERRAGLEAIEEFFPLKPRWDPQRHAIVHAYLLECRQAGVGVTIASLCQEAQVHKTVFYGWIKGQHKPDSAPATRIRRICQTEKPHLKDC